MEYARSLVKLAHTITDGEDATIREQQRPRSSTLSTTFSSPRSLADSYVEGHGEHSEDWSVISDSDDRRSSHHSAELYTGSPPSKRGSIAAAVMSVLPDALQPGSPKNNSRM